MKINTMGPV